VGRTIAVEFPVFNVPSKDTAHCGENYIVVSNNTGATIFPSAKQLLMCGPLTAAYPLSHLEHFPLTEYFTTLPHHPFESTNKIQKVLLQKLVYQNGSFVITAKKWKIPRVPIVGTGQILWYTSSKKYS
jgi:hypothetical protein